MSKPTEPTRRHTEDESTVKRSIGIDRQAADAFARQVGQRVKTARVALGISRKALSVRSTVSLRYLVQLENDGGNASVGVLHRIAQALDVSVASLVCEPESGSSEIDRITERFQLVTREQQAQVRRTLGMAAPSESRGRRICLLGLRGAGKSSLGQSVSEALTLPFVELNDRISAHSELPINELFNLFGAEGYRRFERQSIKDLVQTSDSVVLAVAGGIVEDATTFQLVLDNFHTIWLKADPEDHMNRVRAQGDERPMIGNPQAMQHLMDILASREPHYARADTTVDTSGLSLSDARKALIRAVQQLLESQPHR